MTPPRQAWLRLAEAARRAPVAPDETAPLGFAARVSALAMASDRTAAGPMERIALRAMGIACLRARVAVAVNFSSIAGLFGGGAPPSDDPVAAMVDIAS